ncbi:MAG: hypothetical protein ACFFD4_05480 [Candidatus Odinarchaeota archaeon]
MSSFIPKVYTEDTDKDTIKSLTPVTARKNLRVRVLETLGVLTVDKTLEIKKDGKLNAKGAITIAENLVCNGTADLEGAIKVSGEIIGGNVKVIGHLETTAVNVNKITAKGSFLVKNGIRAEESITLIIKLRSEFSIGGLIEAPVVTLKARSSLGRSIVKLMGIKPKSVLELKDIRIKARKLQLESVRVEGNLEVDEIEEL